MKFVYLLVSIILVYSGYVTIKLWRREEYSRKQKIVQSYLVWFLPIVGALIVHGMIKEFERIPKKRNPNDGQGVDGMPGGVQ